MKKYTSRKLIVLEANLDDMNPEWCPPVTERLFEAGALDVTVTPTVMKKGRPALLLGVLCEVKRKDHLLEIFFEETTTLGVRSYGVTRYELKREIRRVRTPFGTVLVKVGRDAKGRVLNAAPEFESCKELAKKKKIPLKKIYQAALASVS